MLRTHSLDPFLNIATEDFLFNSAKAEEEVLFLWRNRASVIIGRNQNPWKECRLEEMEKRGVELVRRHSGGGAVFHDLGNTNFSFVGPKSRHSKERNCEILLKALKEPFGIQAELKGRNDVVLGETKVFFVFAFDFLFLICVVRFLDTHTSTARLARFIMELFCATLTWNC